MAGERWENVRQHSHLAMPLDYSPVGDAIRQLAKAEAVFALAPEFLDEARALYLALQQHAICLALRT